MSNTHQDPRICHATEQVPHREPSTVQHPFVMVPDNRTFNPTSLNVMQQTGTIHTQHHLLASSNPLLYGHPPFTSQMASPNPQPAPIPIQPRPQLVQNYQPPPDNQLIDPQLLAMSQAPVQNHQQPLTQPSQATGQPAQYQSPLSGNQPMHPHAFFTNQPGTPYHEPVHKQPPPTQQTFQRQSPLPGNQATNAQAFMLNQTASPSREPVAQQIQPTNQPAPHQPSLSNNQGVHPPQPFTPNQTTSLNHQPVPNPIQHNSPLPQTHPTPPHPLITYQTPPPSTQATPPPKPKPLAPYQKPLSSLTPTEIRARQTYLDDYDSDRQIYLSFRDIPDNGLTEARKEVLDRVFKKRTLSTMPRSLKGEEVEKRARLEGVAEVAILRMMVMGRMGGGEGARVVEEAGGNGDEDRDEGEEGSEGEAVVEIGERGEGEEERVSEETTVTYYLNGRAITKEELDGVSR